MEVGNSVKSNHEQILELLDEVSISEKKLGNILQKLNNYE